jgi:hypothetical protein
VSHAIASNRLDPKQTFSPPKKPSPCPLDGTGAIAEANFPPAIDALASEKGNRKSSTGLCFAALLKGIIQLQVISTSLFAFLAPAYKTTRVINLPSMRRSLMDSSPLSAASLLHPTPNVGLENPFSTVIGGDWGGIVSHSHSNKYW